jgi:primosomal protein N' (replication factor Y)
LVAARATGMVEVIGPAPAPLKRIKNRWRWHLLLRSADAVLLGRIVRYAAARNPFSRSQKMIRVVIDRDPVALL